MFWPYKVEEVLLTYIARVLIRHAASAVLARKWLNSLEYGIIYILLHNYSARTEEVR